MTDGKNKTLVYSHSKNTFLLLGVIITLILCVNLVSAEVPSIDNLITYYKFEETSGTIVYDNFGNLNGNVIDTIQKNVTGKIGKAYNFTNEGYINISNGINLYQEGFTINLWLRANVKSDETTQSIFDNRDANGKGFTIDYLKLFGGDTNNRIMVRFYGK